MSVLSPYLRGRSNEQSCMDRNPIPIDPNNFISRVPDLCCPGVLTRHVNGSLCDIESPHVNSGQFSTFHIKLPFLTIHPIRDDKKSEGVKIVYRAGATCREIIR